MGLPSFFVKINKYKRFTYNPRYYDERKEHREELIKQLEEERMRKEGVSVNFHPTLSRGYLTSYRKKLRRKENPTSSIRLIVIIILLGILFYWLLR